MKMIALRTGYLLILTLLVGTISSQARIIRDKQGREINAELVTMVGDDRVTIRSGSREYTIPLETLSEGDQTFIRKYFEIYSTPEPSKTPADSRPTHLSYFVNFDAEHLDQRQIGKANAGGRMKIVPHVCEVSIALSSGTPLVDARVECQVFVENETSSYGVRKDTKRLLKVQEVEVLDAQNRLDMEVPFETKRFYYYFDGCFRYSGSAADKVLGVWIRVYQGGQLFDEYKRDQGGGSIEGLAWREQD